jgi:hypothetical protein
MKKELYPGMITKKTIDYKGKEEYQSAALRKQPAGPPSPHFPVPAMILLQCTMLRVFIAC